MAKIYCTKWQSDNRENWLVKRKDCFRLKTGHLVPSDHCILVEMPVVILKTRLLVVGVNFMRLRNIWIFSD